MYANEIAIQALQLNEISYWTVGTFSFVHGLHVSQRFEFTHTIIDTVLDRFDEMENTRRINEI